MMNEASQILNQLNAGQYAPVYFLQGEEPYYIDLISDFIEQNALDEAAKGFNQIVIYGKDVKMAEVLNNAKRFPMMSDRQLVLVKEAQAIQDIGKESGDQLLIHYLENPLSSTILVFAYKHKKLDRRKALFKSIAKHAVLLTSKKLYDNQIPDWIRTYFKEKEFPVTDKSVYMLAEFIGNNLERLSNEIDKMLINFKEKVEINDQLIQKYIGISKEYNAFELQKAVALKEIIKANKIVNYFEANPKNNPILPIISVLYLFFSKMLIFHAAPNKSDNDLAAAMGINRYFIKDYKTAGNHYPVKKITEIIGHLRHADLQSKGVNAANVPEGQILRELIFKILH